MIEFIKNLFAEMNRYINMKNTIDELHKLSDRELKDIGIYRCDIERVAEDIAYREENSQYR